MSIEQLGEFHLVRRVLKTVAPDFRLLASPDLGSGESALDLKRKTIEIGEDTAILDAVSTLLFHVGHLKVFKWNKFPLFFGKGISTWKGSEESLVKQLAREGYEVDRLACAWAESVFCLYWQVTPEESRNMMRRNLWDESEWREYFSAA